ncbi:MAG TPA: hypothetical protein DCG49_06130 [Ruminococcus sp.]|nr:hypothetical protein [Ruminococcus sp.]
MLEYQAIYANDNGWGIQEASDDLPADAAKSFTDFSTTLNRTFSQYKDSYQGEIYAVKSDGKYLFFLQAANTGESDQSGRSNVRTQGFIFPLDAHPGLLPQNRMLVSFSQQNFTGSLRTEPCVFEEPFPLASEAMVRCGLDTPKLSKLIRCIYTLLLSGAEDTLHIRVPDQKYIRDCMVCIYQGLPYSVRKEVSYSNVPAADGFVTATFLTPNFPEINRHIKYFDLLSGTENVLDAAAESDLEKHTAFHQYVCDSVPYEDALNTLLSEFQKQEDAFHLPETISIAGRLDMIHLICQMIKFDEARDEMTEKEILLLLMRLLNLQLESEFSEDILVRMLHYCELHSLNLNERISASMQKKFSTTKSDAVRDAIFQYQSRQLLYLGKNELCRKLYSMYEEDRPLFEQTVRCLRESDPSTDQENSTDALDLLYSDYIGRNFSGKTLDQIQAFYEEIVQCGFQPHPRSDAMLKERMLLAVETFTVQESPERAVFEPFWEQWNRFLQTLIPEENEQQETVVFGKEMYWNSFDLTRFSEQDIPFYRSMACEPERSKNWTTVRDLIDILLYRTVEDNLRAFSQAAAGAARRIPAGAAREHIIALLIRHARNTYRKPDEINIWIAFLKRMAQLSDQTANFFSFVFRHDIRLMYEDAEDHYMLCNADKNELAEYQRLLRDIEEEDTVSGDQAGELADALKKVSRRKYGGLSGLFRRK